MDTDTGTGNGLVVIPPGRVTLSDRRTRSSWQVEVASFAISAFPVTQSSYAQVTGERPSSHQGDGLPVEGVSWWDAVHYCNALSQREGLAPAYHLHAATETAEWDTSADGYRLPTEAEWEHACRAGSTGPRYGGLDEVAWYDGNSGGRVHPVGLKRANAWGLHDMLGNVWDWCWDVYDAEVYGAYRVLRGGGWADEHWSCRASVRRRSHPTFRIDDVGFRVARSHLA
ncbi:SUMF1/EgtB/PvdO family nonheme iron enzyme [Streptantibioticus parmotrematis]|uniref:formylglycine-generating enzyme family protein n=1 Tax=Streptantibioticus parmotrematis TaxID=2873249 RepID=UPI0033D506FE